MNESRADLQPPGVGIHLPPTVQRLAWAGVACTLVLSSLGRGPATLLGTQIDQQVTRSVLDAPPALAHGATTAAEVRVPGLRLTFDLRDGRISMRWSTDQGGPPTLSGVAGVRLRGTTGSGQAGELLASDYAHHSISMAPAQGPLGRGTLVVFSHTDRRFPPLQQRLLISAGGAVELSTEIGSAHGPYLEADHIDPLIVAGQAAAGIATAGRSLVFTANGSTADHMPRLFTALAALPNFTAAPYMTVIGAPAGAVLAGALSAANWFPSVLIGRGSGGLQSLSLSEDGPMSGSLLTAEPFLIGRYASTQAALRAYASAVQRVSQPLPAARDVQLGWSSWGAYELGVSDARVRRNVAFMAAHLRALGYTTVHIDDGWEQRYGDWQPGKGFPRGMAALVRYIHAHGLKASIWFAPFLATPDSWPARRHPEWLLRGPDGSPVTITIAGPTYVLDATNPAALAYIRSVCARIRAWGFDAVKLDFLYAGSLQGQRYRFDMNGLQAYNAAMAAIRGTLESDPWHPLYLTGVQQGLLPAGYFQAWRVGRDIESKTNADHIPTWDLIRREALSVSAFAFADGAMYGTDPDDLLLRSVPGARNLSRDELQSYATMAALGGSVWLSGDDLPALDREGRLSYLTNPDVLAVVRAGQAGTPVQVDDQAQGPAALWKAAQPGGSTVIGLFNWSDRPRRFTVSFADLGLSANQPYTVRDLWARATLLHAARAFSCALRPHQSYLLRISAGL